MTSYPKSGPFTNGQAPGITASFLNLLEQYLGYAADSNITTDGSGNMTVKSSTFTHGKITQFTVFTGNGAVTGVAHGCSSTPVAIFVNYIAGAGNFGTPPPAIPYAWNVGATTCNIVATNGYNWCAIAIVN